MSANWGRPGSAAEPSRLLGRVKKRARSPTPAGCPRQLRRSTIEQRMKIEQKNSTEGDSLYSTDMMDSNIRVPNVVSAKHLIRRSVRRTHFKRGTEGDEMVHVQKSKCMMLEEPKYPPQSSKYDHFNQGDDVRGKTVKGPKHKRCQARKRKKEYSSRVCKVGDMIKKNWKNTEFKATIESLQVSLKNGCSKTNPSEELVKWIERSHSKNKSLGADVTTENVLTHDYSKILLENGLSELSRVIQKRIQHPKALNNVSSESDTASGNIEKAGMSNVPEVPSKTESLELSWHPQYTCHNAAAWSKEKATDVTRDSLEQEIKALSDVRAVEPATDFEPDDTIVLDEPKGLPESWEQKVSEHTHSKSCVSQFGCARMTPISLDTCARIRPFRRSKLCTKFWFGSAWFCKQEEMSGQHCDGPILKTKSGAVSYQGLHCRAVSNIAGNQEYLESVENVVYLFAMLSLGVPELKQINKDNSQEKAILENNYSCSTFEQDQVTKMEPPVHPPMAIECNRELKSTHNNAETSPTIDVPNCTKVTNSITEGIKCPIRKSALNLISLSPHYTETLALAKRPELHIPLCNGTEGKTTSNCQRHIRVWDKSTSSKGCLEQQNDVQPVVNHVYQNESAGLWCTQLDVLELNKQTESEEFDAVCPLLAPENNRNLSEIMGVNDHSLLVSLCPSSDYNIENTLNSARKENAQGTSSLENQQVVLSSKEPFVVKQAAEGNEGSHSEEKHFLHKVPDIIRAYKEDVLVLDVIQDDPELFGSPSNTSEMVQEEADCTEVEVKSVDGKLANELTIIQQDSDDRISSACLYVPKEATCGNPSKCTNPQQDELKAQSDIPLSKKHNLEEDLQVETLVNEEELIESGVNMCQVVSSTALVFETVEQQDGKGTETSINSSKDHCTSGPTMENDFSLKPLCSESSVGKLALTNNLKLAHEHLLPATSARATVSLQLNNSEYCAMTRPFNCPLDLTAPPSGYCRFYFTTVRGCKKKQCKFEHGVKKGDEKFCMEIVQKFMESGNLYLFLRAVRIFRNYYRNFQPGIYHSYQVMNRLLITLLKLRRCQDVFEILNLAINMNTLPDAEIVPNVFDLVASTDSKALVPDLIIITCKLVEAGLKFQLDQFNYMIRLLNQLQASYQEIHLIMALKPRLFSHQTEAEAVFDLDFAIAEVEQYKEKGEWNRMGILFQSLLQNRDGQSEIHRIATCIAIAIIKSKDNGAAVPFCEFAKAVYKGIPPYILNTTFQLKMENDLDLESATNSKKMNSAEVGKLADGLIRHHNAQAIVTMYQKSHLNGIAKKLLGMIGISVLVAYYKSEQWRKGRKVLDMLQEIQVNFTILKGLVSEFTMSRCQIINIAGEIFLKAGCVNRALWLLRESNWITNSPTWPCHSLDVLNRHNFLFSLSDVTLKNNMYCETLEVLQHLPGLRKVNGTLDVTPYVRIFNNLLDQCIQNNCLGASSDTVEFMRSMDIPISPLAVRNLITALGRSNLWLKARTQYKKALSNGCYPPVEENLYRKLLPIPCFLSEVEMLLATEMFLVTNASNIQSPSVSKQSLQIVLRRYEDEGSFANGDYEAAVDRLQAAARISEPKLQIKHTTVNIAKEEVFSLEYSSALRWLEQNMKWAGKVWLFG